MKIKPSLKPGRVLVELNRRDDQLLDGISRDAQAAASPFHLKKILVPIDFSELSRKALHYALSFAQQFCARLILLHVVEPRAHPESYIRVPPGMELGNAARLNELERKLEHFRRHEIAPKLKADSVVQMGKPGQEIINLAKARQVDLIILATHGHAGLKRVLLGSTAESVVRHAPCPVLVVREREQEFLEPAESLKEVL